MLSINSISMIMMEYNKVLLKDNLIYAKLTSRKKV